VIVYYTLYFQVFLLGVYKQYEQLMSIAVAWNFTWIWHMAHGCLDIRHFTKYTSGISYILMEIPTYYYHADGTQRYLHLTAFHYCMIVPWCLPIVTAFILCTPCTHCVDILTWVLRIRNVYIWYTNSIHLSIKRYIVYTTCIHPVSFSRLHIRPSHIYAFSNITFSYCPTRLRMLASG